MTDEQIHAAKIASKDYKKMIRDLIDRFSREGDVVYDPMAGSGVHLYLAQKMGRQVVGVDIDGSYENSKLGIQQGDSSDTNFPDETFDFAITSINPYGEPTSDAERAAANLETLEQYMRMLDGVMKETYRTLLRGSYMVNIAAAEKEHINRCHKIFNKYFEFIGKKRVKSDKDMVIAKNPKQVVVMLYRKPKNETIK